MHGNVSAHSCEVSGDSFKEQRVPDTFCTHVRYPHTHLFTTRGIDKLKRQYPKLAAFNALLLSVPENETKQRTARLRSR